MSSAKKLRVRAADITPIEYPIVFKGKQHTLNLIVTCYGDFLVQSLHGTKVLIDTEDAVAASNHFSTISKRTPTLQHGNLKLEDHIKVLFTARVCWGLLGSAGGGSVSDLLSCLFCRI